MRAITAALLLLSLTVLAAEPALAQGPPPYGTPISLEQAKKVLTGAEAEADGLKWSRVGVAPVARLAAGAAAAREPVVTSRRRRSGPRRSSRGRRRRG